MKNKIHTKNIIKDLFYLEGIVNDNKNDTLTYSINEFTLNVWNFWDLKIQYQKFFII